MRDTEIAANGHTMHTNHPLEEGEHPAGRRRALKAIATGWWSILFAAGPAHSAPPALPAASDLAADGATAKAQRVPVLLFFNRVGCPYCERALREFLKPMERDPDNAGRLLFRQVEIDKPSKLVDFAGNATTHRKFAQQFNITLTPTIWFVDGEGNPLVEPIVGLRTIDYYGYYLDQSINESLYKLRKGT